MRVFLRVVSCALPPSRVLLRVYPLEKKGASVSSKSKTREGNSYLFPFEAALTGKYEEDFNKQGFEGKRFAPLTGRVFDFEETPPFRFF